MADLAEEHRAAVATRSVGDRVELFTGIDAIRHRFLQVQSWARTAHTQFPDHEAAVACTTAALRPVHCVIEVSWSEKSVAINRSTVAAAAVMTSRQQYTLYVEP